MTVLPALTSKMKKEKSKNHLDKNQISRGSKTRSRSPSTVLHSHDQPEPVESKLGVHHGHYLLSAPSEPACSNDQFVSKGLEKRTLAGLKAHFQRSRVRPYRRISLCSVRNGGPPSCCGTQPFRRAGQVWVALGPGGRASQRLVAKVTEMLVALGRRKTRLLVIPRTQVDLLPSIPAHDLGNRQDSVPCT